MASCSPAGLTARLSASVVSITLRSNTYRTKSSVANHNCVCTIYSSGNDGSTGCVQNGKRSLPELDAESLPGLGLLQSQVYHNEVLFLLTIIGEIYTHNESYV